MDQTSARNKCGDSRPRLSTGQSPVPLVLVLPVWHGHSCPSPLICHPERSMTPTKWTSCAVEGSLPPAHHRRPDNEFPPAAPLLTLRNEPQIVPRASPGRTRRPVVPQSRKERESGSSPRNKCGDSRPRLSTGQSPVPLVLVLLVWNGHSCPLPLTLGLILLLTLN